MLLLAQIQPTSYTFNLRQLILFQQALKYRSVPVLPCSTLVLYQIPIVFFFHMLWEVKAPLSRELCEGNLSKIRLNSF